MKTRIEETSIKRGLIVMAAVMFMLVVIMVVLALTVTYVQRQSAEIESMKCSSEIA